MAEEIPPRLKERWEKFGSAARKCWAEAKKVPEGTEIDFKQFWSCMRREARDTGELSDAVEAHDSPIVTPELIKKCAEIGRPLAPHPICVMRKVAEDKTEKEAISECLKEGRVHGISLLACRAALGE